MDVLLRRLHRTVWATGPSGAPLHPDARGWVADALTYYERKFDYTNAAEGGSKIELTERKLYSVDPETGAVIFPLGIRSRVVKGLKTRGFNVLQIGGTLLQELSTRNPDAVATDWDGLLSDFKIYPGQDECLARIVSADGGIIAANTGWGKSVIIRMLCRLYNKAKIHVVTKSKTLAKEIFADLSQIIPSLGFVGDGKNRFDRVTVLMADSLHHGMGDSDILIYDEAHESCAPSYTAKLGMYARARMFGMTATPTGRMDNRDIVLEAVFGPVLYTFSYQEAQAAGRVVPMTVEWLRVDRGPDVTGITLPAIREKIGIWQNRTRNQIIADRVKRCDPDDQIMIMVKTIEHAAQLKALLPDYTLAYASNGMDDARLSKYISRGLLPADEPKMTSARLEQLRKEFAAGTLKKVISNYVWSTGVNFPLLNVLVRADTAASEIKDGQIPGRACRRVAGVKESALLIDCDDGWNSTLNRKAQGRRRNYQKRGWLQTWSDQGGG